MGGAFVMKLEPVKKYRILKYPMKSEVIHNPAVLKDIPERWKGNISIGIALSSIITITLTGCGSGQGATNGISAGDGNADPISSSITDQGAQNKAQAVVAPIFEHGNGRGSFGCMSIAPPSFLSEEEAFQAVQEEAVKYGIIFEKNSHELKKVGIPETKFYLKPENDDAGYNEDAGEIKSTKNGNLMLDGYSTDKRIGFEFVSSADYKEWEVNQGTRSTVDDYDFLSTAKLLQKGIEDNKQDTNIGVFYNPMTPYEDIKPFLEVPEKKNGESQTVDFDMIQAKTNEMALEQLRLQVRDFLEWLKAQGVI